MKKTFVLDTNVLLHDPAALERFADQRLVIPIYAIEEVDRFKRELSERGRSARLFSRRLDALRAGGSLADGVPTATGKGSVRVAFIDPDSPQATQGNAAPHADDLILSVALQEQRRDAETPVVVVTRDVNMRIRADAMGLQAVGYRDVRMEVNEFYSGTREIDLPGQAVDRLYTDGALPHDDAVANECFLVRNESNPNHAALARYHEESSELVALKRIKQGVWGIRPRNKEQHYALDLLLDDEVKLVTLVGKAGTGKTLLAIAAGLHRAINERRFKKLLVSRPIFPLGRDIGFLPGDVEEKLNPWMQPIYDNVELLLSAGQGEEQREKDRGYRDLVDLGYIQVEPLTYIRGRSIPSQYMIVDEAQNLTPLEVKTILTRAGDGTKIVLTGDPYQIDNPYVDASSNGLSTVVERFKGKRVAGHVTLVKGERSELAELAANIL